MSEELVSKMFHMCAGEIHKLHRLHPWAVILVSVYKEQGNSAQFKRAIRRFEALLHATEPDLGLTDNGEDAPPTLGINVQEEIQTDEKIGGG
jgi:hypothetical protein